MNIIQHNVNPIKTNDLKKGDFIIQRNNWKGIIADNMKGNTRMAKVFGNFTEIGSVYSHDIIGYQKADYVSSNFSETEKIDSIHVWNAIEHTKAQLDLKKKVDLFY